MTKPSDIMVCPVVPLSVLTDAERDVIRNFLFGCIKGLDAKHDARWRRLWARIWKAAPGEVTHLHNLVDRSGPYHRMHMGFEDRLFKAQEKFTNPDRFRDWLKTGAGWGQYAFNKHGAMKFVPASTSYEQCSDDEMREFHANAMEFMNTPRAQARLWGHLPAKQRAAMLDAVLANPEEQT